MKRLLRKMLVFPLLALAACASTASQAPRATAPTDTTLRKPTAAVASALMPAEDVTK